MLDRLTLVLAVGFRLLLAALMGLVIAACAPGDPEPLVAGTGAALPADLRNRQQTGEPVGPVGMGPTPQSYSVVAYGYNYTDLYIDSFEVDGAGGGNLAVSTPTSGGGGHACCAAVTAGLPAGTTFNIKWTRDRKRWCQQEVALKEPIPSNPRYFEVHFYPSGKIEIAVTQKASPPRLKLERFSRGERHAQGNVNNDETYSRCKDGYR